MVLYVGFDCAQGFTGASNARITPAGLHTQLDQPEPSARVATTTGLIPAPFLVPHLPSAGVAGDQKRASKRWRKELFMTSDFQQQHGAMLLKYSGISFISGAVNHGFFSGERSLWTAAIGMVLFVLGAWLEHLFDEPSAQNAHQGLLKTLAVGSLLSIGLGFFTGGLQHFPDSPARSSWVVPLGFFVSVLALAWTTPRAWQRAATAYVLAVGALVSVGSYGAWKWFEQHPQWAATGHHHGDAIDGVKDDVKGDAKVDAKGDVHGAPAKASAGMTALVISRTIEVSLDDKMRFTPDQLEVKAGETIRFVVHNTGKTAHEMVLGSDEDIRSHAQAMKAGESQNTDHDAAHANAHGAGAAISVAAGQRGELVVSFTEAAQLQMACLLPGHYEAGMRGKLSVLPTSPTRSSKAPANPHDHSSHKH